MPDPALLQALQGSERKLALLDTNLLVLLISAKLGPETLNGFKRVQEFAWQDAVLLNWLLSKFSGVVTTAYVLAEVSNLANALTGDLRERWFHELANFAVITEEEHVATQIVAAQNELVRFGIADSALSYISKRHTIITSEYRLSGYLESLGRHVINFNHLRPLWIANA